MKNKWYLVTILAGSMLFTACGNKFDVTVSTPNTEDTNVSQMAETKIIKISEENEVAISAISSPEKSTMQVFSVKSELTGDERAYRRKTTSNCDILSKAENEANVLESITQGTDVDLLGQTEDGEFYKIVYNGRIAYIKASAITTAVANTTPSRAQTATQNATTQAATQTATSVSKEQNTRNETSNAGTDNSHSSPSHDTNEGVSGGTSSTPSNSQPAPSVDPSEENTNEGSDETPVTPPEDTPNIEEPPTPETPPASGGDEGEEEPTPEPPAEEPPEPSEEAPETPDATGETG